MSLTTMKEGTGAKYTATLQDADDVVIPLGNLTTITLTLYDFATGTIINSREDVDVKNANDVTIHATSGLLTWLIQEEDNLIVTPANYPEGSEEKHIALFEFVYVGDGTPGKHEAILMVENLKKV